ncbi:MAG TPA: dihydrolipoamide acetyltransferase family protein [Gemmataceae bacterium]|jgi:pyruvate dehydrogenase E2 component (dihydrolipoamide acetyltransferase)/2-oxoisovalerate dehydrogenase E2 component (dihydrolipoyl transacylase)|nr:dihydrolipoamide acetyltransferase family protein [Gemmataceae bacterium]
MDFHLPQLGEGVYEAEMIRWLVTAGDAVKHGQGLMEVMTDKATMEVPAPFAGTITEQRVQPGTTIKVGDLILTYTPAGAVPEEIAPPVPAAVARPDGHDALAGLRVEPGGSSTALVSNGYPSDGDTPAAVKASPSVRLLARKLGIDLKTVHGSGPAGRVLLEDLHLPAAGSATGVQHVPVPVAAKLDFGRPGTVVKLAGVRRRIAEHLVHAKHTIPHFTYVDECDISELVKLRASLREPFEAHGLKLTYLPFFVKAVVAALKDVPIVNSSLVDDTGEIVLHDRYHIGIATATPAGLLVPVVRDADKKDLATIAREIERLSAEARSGRARLEDMRGSTFTITSIGGIGGLLATPIINHPEVAILGLGRVVKRPVFDAAGNVKPAEMIYLSLSFDHRVVDGAIGAVFGNALIRQLHNPARLLLSERLV